MITPEAAGPDGFYFDHAGADVFEVWADVARRYALDPDWTVIAGYSMGGYGAYKLAVAVPRPVRARRRRRSAPRASPPSASTRAAAAVAAQRARS